MIMIPEMSCIVINIPQIIMSKYVNDVENVCNVISLLFHIPQTAGETMIMILPMSGIW